MNEPISPEVPGAPQPRRRTPLLPWLIVAALALALAGAGAYIFLGRGTSLERTDPAGAKACRDLRAWLDGDLSDPKTGKRAEKGITAAMLGSEAKDAKTPEIRTAAGTNLLDDPDLSQLKDFGAPAEMRFANMPKLHAACVGAGESMPAYVEP